MAGVSSCHCQKKLEDALTDYGMKLMNPPSSIEELLKLLDEVGSLLKIVDQSPSDSMTNALQPVVKTLIGKELLNHTDIDVKVSVACCISEFSRITAPQHPFNDSLTLKETLQLTVMALEKISDVGGRSYFKAVQILETVALVRACVMLLDLECDALVIEIFQLFLRIIRPYHPHNVFAKMEEIMTQLIEDSDEISIELLQPLLDSVKKENQIASPISWKLGEKVLEDCASTVKPYLTEALKSLSLNLDDYTEIVATICSELPERDQMMANENAPDIVHPLKVGPFGANSCETVLQDDTCREQLKDTCTANIMKPDIPKDMQLETNAEVASRSRNKLVDINAQHPSESTNSDISKGSDGRGAQAKKKESIMIEEERTKDTEISIKSVKVRTEDTEEPSLQQIDGMKQTNSKATIQMHDIDESADKATMLSVRDENFLPKCSKSEPGTKVAKRKDEDSERLHTIKGFGEELIGSRIRVWWPSENKFYEGSISSFDSVEKKHTVLHVDGDVKSLNLQKEQWEMVENSSSEKVANENSPGTVPVKVDPSNGKRKPGRFSKKNESASKYDAVKKSEISINSEEGNISGAKQQSLQQIYRRRQKKNDTTIKKRNKESEDKDSKRPYTVRDCGEELVGARINIWWPRNEAFYEATVSSYDPVEKKHKVLYGNGVLEKVNLGKKRWEMIEASSSKKDSKKHRTVKDYGEELVGDRIKVWWPLDKAFYEGVVYSFDPEMKLHKVKYADGDVEDLNLREERWEMLRDQSSEKDHGVNFQAPGDLPATKWSTHKKAKRSSQGQTSLPRRR